MPRPKAKLSPVKRLPKKAKQSKKTPLAHKPPPIEPVALRVPQAAKALNISERTAWDWAKKGILERITPSPGITLISMRSIQALLP
jgi:hypothetical protein